VVKKNITILKKVIEPERGCSWRGAEQATSLRTAGSCPRVVKKNITILKKVIDNGNMPMYGMA
jgi:hypothetical protein